jgi:hypothetical protein
MLPFDRWRATAIKATKLKAYIDKDQAIPHIRPSRRAPVEEQETGGDDIGDAEVEHIGQLVQDGKGDPALMKLAAGMTEETNPAAWIADEDTWERAKQAVKPSWDKYDEPYSVVVHVYKAMGGKVKK